jgi:hypothetical protein
MSSYKGRDVGFDVQITPQGNENGFHNTGIELKSLGKASDDFLKALASIYNLKVTSDLQFINSFSTTYANLDEIAGKKSQDIVSKLFLGDPNSEKDYGEVYLNIYEGQGKVEVLEKDIEYRQSVIKAFSKK